MVPLAALAVASRNILRYGRCGSPIAVIIFLCILRGNGKRASFKRSFQARFWSFRESPCVIAKVKLA